MSSIKAYKAFNSDWTCQGFKYEVGKKYEYFGDIEMCEIGFHACHVLPLDVLEYYGDNLFTQKYAEVELSGKIEKNGNKSCASKIKIKKEHTFQSFFNLHFSLVVDLCKKSKNANTSGDKSHANTSEKHSHANTSGDKSHANTSGDESHANTSGDASIACSLGMESTASASLNNWLVLAEYSNEGKLLHVKTAKVDNKKIKANTPYILENGEFKKIKKGN